MVQGLTGGGTSGTSSPAFISQVYNSLGNTYPVSEAGIQAAINALPTANLRIGWVKLPRATIDISTGLTLGKQARLIGSGPKATILNVTADVDAITVNPANNESAWSIENLTIDMNEVAANGVVSTHAGFNGTTNSNYMGHFRIINVKAGQAGIQLRDIFRTLIDEFYIVTKGSGIVLSIDDSQGVHFGNSTIRHGHITATANGAILMDWQSAAGGGETHVLCLMRVEALHLLCDTFTTTTGLRMRGIKDCAFFGLNIENGTLGIDQAAQAVSNLECNNNHFFGTRIYNAQTSAVKLADGSYWNQFYGGYMGVDGAGDNIIDDDNTLATKPNRFEGIQFVTGTFDLSNGSQIYGCNGCNTEEYQTQAGGAWVDPLGPVWTGRVVEAYNSNIGAYRKYVYLNGGWHYVAYT